MLLPGDNNRPKFPAKPLDHDWLHSFGLGNNGHQWLYYWIESHTEWRNIGLGRPGMAGSYGFNGWMANPPATAEAGDPQAPGYWKKLTTAGRYANAPLFADCVWQGSNPAPTDQPPTASGECAVDAAMPSFCIPRHTGRAPLNMAFIDGSVSFVGLRQIWQLPWSVTFNPAQGPALWPTWLKAYN